MYLISTVTLHWLAPNLSDALSLRSWHVSLSTWGSHPASLLHSLRRSRLTTLPPLLLRCCCCECISNGMRLKCVRKRSYVITCKGIRKHRYTKRGIQSKVYLTSQPNNNNNNSGIDEQIWPSYRRCCIYSRPFDAHGIFVRINCEIIIFSIFSFKLDW